LIDAAVAVALEIVAQEVAIVVVGEEGNPLGSGTEMDDRVAFHAHAEVTAHQNELTSTMALKVA
jgi:hypothetical protein